MRNLFFLLRSVGAEGAFYQGMGDAKPGSVDVRDIADGIRTMGQGEWGAAVMRDYRAAYSRGWGEFVKEVLAPALSKE